MIDALKSINIKDGEIVVLRMNEQITSEDAHKIIDSIPDDLKGRVFLVSSDIDVECIESEIVRFQRDRIIELSGMLKAANAKN